MAETLPQAIRSSLAQSKFKWRTAEGVARDARLDLQQVVQTLENSGEVIRGSRPNKNGKAVYTLRSAYVKGRPVLQRLVGILANSPE